ncbi:MAG: AAA family ATPase [Ghiorsea sp.]|nr:AAA family ATPase [Ghiorsea sp.]
MIMTNLEQFMQKTGLSGASIARSLGVSTATVSLVKNGKTEKIAQTVLNKFSDFIRNYTSQTGAVVSNVQSTSDLKMIEFTLHEMVVAQEMGSIFGKAGSGKTTAIKHFCQSHPEAILIETTPFFTARGLLKEILAGQGEKEASGSATEMIHRSVSLFKKSEQILIIDEAENLTTNNLEAIRRIHDFSSVPIALVGTYALVQNLKGRHGDLNQLSGRIMHTWEMKGLDKTDLTQLFGEFGKLINIITKDTRRATSIFRKAQRLSQLQNEPLTAQHIRMAAQTAILN